MITIKDFTKLYLSLGKKALLFEFDDEELGYSDVKCKFDSCQKNLSKTFVLGRKNCTEVFCRDESVEVYCCLEENCYQELFSAFYKQSSETRDENLKKTKLVTDYPSFGNLSEILPEEYIDYIFENDREITEITNKYHFKTNKFGGYSTQDDYMFHPEDSVLNKDMACTSTDNLEHIVQFVPPGLNWGAISLYKCHDCGEQFSYFHNNEFK